MSRHHISFPVFLLVALILASCASRKTAATLNDVETYIQDRPDSALATIRAIDTTSLTTRSLRAHYALLHAMALDKNWIDTTDVNVVMPAVEYYAKHGTADQKMKAYYYLGRIYENQGDNNEAILAYTLADEVSPSAKDLRLNGLLKMGLSRIYSIAHQTDKALDYALLGISLFQSDGDTLHYNSAIGRLAMLYQEKREWFTADSLYTIAVRIAEKDTVSMSLYLSHYASMKVVQPDANPQEAIALLRRKIVEYKRKLTLKDYGVYAYASAMQGDDKTCDDILALIHKQSAKRRKETSFLEYKIARFRGNFPLAIELFNASFNDQNEMVDQLLNRSVNQTLEEYYENQAVKTKHRSQVQQLVWALVLLSVIMAGGIVLIFIKRKHERDLQKRHQLEQEKSSLQDAVTALSDRMTEMNAQQALLQREFTAHLQSTFREWGQLYKAYYHSKENPGIDVRDNVYYEARSAVAKLSGDKEGQRLLERRLNEVFNEVMTHYRADFPDLSEADYRFASFVFAGFDASVLKAAFQIPSIPATYERKSRLKDMIVRSTAPNKEQYLRFFR